MSTPPLPPFADAETERLIKNPPPPVELSIDPLVEFLLAYISRDSATSLGATDAREPVRKVGETSEC